MIDGIVFVAMDMAVVFVMLVVMVVVTMSMRVRVTNAIGMFVHVEMRLIGLLHPVHITFDVHDRPFEAS